ncbi:M3 family metallopeptidase [Lutibaculum baratangense]|uniref:Dipeptidyl carboxypeptidase Dcp n=1 Tax=Lutibaculum baratangense AMV1 TaxID=631454 RepID=V4RGI5_9HYPH|nr:M3 family metallopeptidase [Lutibaculum baratangense]ESR25271.1 Dipeptidyl carboxypeptidase Dcp [Lutibaculum baratangense AMV1]
MSIASAGPGPDPAALNPLLGDWQTPFGLPPFDLVGPEHFRPAFEQAIAAHEAEIVSIGANPAEPDFENTITALERSGRLLRQVASVFYALAGADTNDEIQAIEREISPRLARHRSALYLDDRIFARIDALAARRGRLALDAEQNRVLERYRTVFTRAGAGKPADTKARLAEIAERMASLGTSFSQNVLADEKGYSLVLESEDDLAGLPDFLRDAAADAAEARGLPGKHVITLSRSSIEPFLQFSTRRDLREQAFAAWTSRGESGGATDNTAIMAEMLALRAEKARLLGHDTFAHFRLADEMAKTPDAVLKLLHSVWEPAKRRATEDAAALQSIAQDEGGNFEIAPWDWRFYAERRRKAEFDLDEETLKPFFQLDRMIEAAFYTASRLFGLSFEERKDLKGYHRDVRVFEVKDAQGRHLGLFLGDYFARSSKRSGAWMSQLRPQHRLAGAVTPIVVNVMNFARASGSAPTLLSFDDARTLFHEFGHALHGLLSDVTYPMISGTAVSRDWVEFPSQLFEHWLEEPEVLKRFALHYRTGEPMPDELFERLMAARSFNEGFATAEYLGSAIVDMQLHLAPVEETPDFRAFETGLRRELGMPDAIVLRHRLPHFAHIFSGDGYSAAYYSYMWSEVLDSDGFEAFVEAGDPFDPTLAKKLRDFVYAAGFKRDPEEAYLAFRGRAPEPGALLRQRGLVAPVEAEA